MELPLYTGIPQFTHQFCSWKMQKLMRDLPQIQESVLWKTSSSITCECDILWLFNAFVPRTEPICSHATSQSLKAYFNAKHKGLFKVILLPSLSCTVILQQTPASVYLGSSGSEH
jgi:hypothetical protein